MSWEPSPIVLPTSAAYQEGYAARRAGQPKTACPYSVAKGEARAAHDWHDGWVVCGVDLYLEMAVPK